jgi:hypothetical protein
LNFKISRKVIAMLVTFSSPAYADITMFGDVAVSLLKLMGHSGTVPSALLAEDVQPALEQLESALKKQAALQEPDESSGDEEDNVSLMHRAMPLIELLKASAADECNVMWKSN